MNYLTLKYLHIFCVAASFALFFIRGIWVIRSYPPAQERWARVLPHAIDGLLLATAIAMVATAPATIWEGSWLTVKISLVVIYVVTSLALMKVARSTSMKVAIWTLALLLFLFTTTVAVLHHPRGIFLLV
jgi:uncharacterized membrane protein SirB2